MALLFDRRQASSCRCRGPAGVAALWHERCRLTPAVVTTVLIVLGTILGNGSLPNSFGVAARRPRVFQWPTLPVLLLRLFRALPVGAVEGAGDGPWACSPVVAVIFVVQSLPSSGTSTSTSITSVRNRPPTGLVGGLDPSPILGYIGNVQVSNLVHVSTARALRIVGTLSSTIPWGNPRVWWGLVCLLLVGAAGVYCLVRLLQSPTPPAPQRPREPARGRALAFGLTLSSAVLLPSGVDLPRQWVPRGDRTVHGTSRVVSGRGLSTAPWRSGRTGPFFPAGTGPRSDTSWTTAHLVRASATAFAIGNPSAKDLTTLNEVDLSDGKSRIGLLFSLGTTREAVIAVNWARHRHPAGERRHLDQARLLKRGRHSGSTAAGTLTACLSAPSPRCSATNRP